MSIIKFFKVALLCGLVVFAFSCQKTNNTIPAINSPLLVLTPSIDSGYAGDQVATDYSATATNSIKKIQIYTQFLNSPKVTVKDSTLATTSAAIDLNFVYTIPDSAVRGNQSYLTFVITDGSGNATTKTATITVTGSRPSITITPTSPSANAGDTVVFNVSLKSPDKSIQTLDVTQAINTGSATALASETFPGNRLAVDTTYKYPVPSSPTVKSGDMLHLVFNVVNSGGVSNFATAIVKVN